MDNAGYFTYKEQRSINEERLYAGAGWKVSQSANTSSWCQDKSLRPINFFLL